ncbi:PocR ligand-binding domain-containing protein [Desulfovibrio sp. TomC]|uniref:PocR ligand-binding domain-containing protein n=1 Tax=Desulfovibrio sp. TomC TaxID=1562888 RepID=UPI0005736E51|nr:PocR ligand-binding domain-containing protein [Desulfovibrio sp. TomC]KHK03975.1 Circadian input kinase A [Desulfovibrio sp. TomC]
MPKDPAESNAPPPPSGCDLNGAPSAGTPWPRDPETVRFEDIFCLEEIQRIQDAFAEAAGVASLITDPQGLPLTQPSNFTTLCATIIRGTEKGRINCTRSDACLGHGSVNGPTIRHCLSGGLLDGGTPIFVGNRHIANWLVGQVVDESADTESMMAYAREIGADETAFREALAAVPRISHARFEKICQALYHFANHLSALAVTNFEQSRRIGELRQAQSQVKQSDRKLAEIIDFLPDPTLVVDSAGKVTFWNKALEKLTGVAAADMLGKGDFAYGEAFYGRPTPLLIDYARGVVPHPDARYTVADHAPGEIIAEVVLSTLPGGIRQVWAKAVALYDEAGKVTGAIEVIRDVTERHRSETALRESEAMFRRIVETAHEGVWVFDGDYATTFVNQRMADMLGYRPEEMSGRRLVDFLPEESLAEAKHQQHRRRQGLSDVFEQQMQRKDGTPLWVLISASPLYDASGQFLGALGMFSDLTARKAVEEELRRHQQRLEAEVEERTRELRLQAMELAEANIRMSELDRLKSAFLSTVSHELRTPLTSILGFAKLIGREFSEHFQPLCSHDEALAARGKRIGHNLGVVYGEAERLTRLINDVLDLNRIESGNMQWRDACIDPVSVTRQAVHTIEGQLAQRPEIHFRFTADETAPQLLMDPDQLVQVVSNLLQNAIKFTEQGEVSVDVRRDGKSVLLVVRDQGVGIPSDQLESIFDRFHQVGRGDTIVSPAIKGTGLGLAICRQIVRHYGGNIWAESQPGAGSSFYVRLPVAEACLETSCEACS